MVLVDDCDAVGAEPVVPSIEVRERACVSAPRSRGARTQGRSRPWAWVAAVLQPVPFLDEGHQC
eukprot:4172088-Pyramimonas_sp.AAC.1